MLSLGLSFAVQALVAYALGTTFSSGPYALIAANFVSFVLDIPPVHKFTLFGYQMTDKVCHLGLFLTIAVSNALQRVALLRPLASTVAD